MAVRRRVAILGGGCAGVAAALELTRSAELRERFDVTLYSQGWRLGGKGASGRAASPDRRIEEHGLHLWMGWYFTAFRVMREMFDEWTPPADSPFRDCASAFTPLWDITLIERHEGALLPWPVRLPPTPGRPWDDSVAPLRSAREVGEWMRSFALDSDWGLPALLANPGTSLRRARISARLAAVLLRGWSRDVRPWGDDGYARIDDVDLRAWLARHGAEGDAIIDAPPIRALYDLAFAPDGGLAAGAALRTLLHVATAYRGAPFFRMPFGMGDTVFSPALDVLRARGVTVELMHRVEALRLDATQSRIDRVELRRQARTRDGAPLDGRVNVHGIRAWLADAPWDALEHGDALRAAGARFESPAWTGGDAISLERERDFDAVILAIPAPACPAVVADLTTRLPAWRAMIETSATAATRSVQLWVDRPVERAGRVSVGHARPHASRADMSDVIAAESWGPDRVPRGLVYICDALPDGASPSDVGADLDRWLTTEAPSAWPGFTRDWLVAPPHARANVEGSDRYVLSRPGTTQHRIAPAATGVENLYVAGDWVRTSINGGSVEAAFEAGVRAAEAIVGTL